MLLFTIQDYTLVPICGSVELGITLSANSESYDFFKKSLTQTNLGFIFKPLLNCLIITLLTYEYNTFRDI